MATIYIHEIDSIACNNSELYLSNNNNTVVFNTATLFRDLPTIIEMVCKENKKEQERILHQLKISLNNI